MGKDSFLKSEQCFVSKKYGKFLGKKVQKSKSTHFYIFFWPSLSPCWRKMKQANLKLLVYISLKFTFGTALVSSPPTPPSLWQCAGVFSLHPLSEFKNKALPTQPHHSINYKYHPPPRPASCSSQWILRGLVSALIVHWLFLPFSNCHIRGTDRQCTESL